MTSERLSQEDQLTLFAGDSPAKTCPLLDAVQDWLESGARYSSDSCASSMMLVREQSSSKMCPVFCHRTEEKTWVPSSGSWRNAGIGGPTGCLTLNTSESPKDAAECSLSEILERDVPQKYSLSARACKGLLRHARRRRKKIPLVLESYLEGIAQT